MRKFFILLIILLIPGICLASEPEEFDTEVFFRRVKEVEVPIVMYHLVTENPKYIGKFGITPTQLEQDLQYLKANKYNTIVIQDLIDFVNRGKKLPKNPIILTFDDGNSSDYHFLLPLLQKYKMKAVISVIGEATDYCTVEAEEKPDGRFPHLTWPQMKEMIDSGRVEIQSHSYDLHKLPHGSGKKGGESPEAYHNRLFTDLQKMQEACNIHLGCVPTAFVYPFGIISDGSREVFEQLGMSASISCQEGKNIIRQGDKDCLFRLNRTNRPSKRSIKDILE